MNARGFTIIELLVVFGIIAILASMLFPALMAHMEGARIEQTRAQLTILEAALAQYHRAWGDHPPAAGNEGNAGIETMLDCLRRRTDRGGPFIKETMIRSWLGDTDGDGRREMVDPWQDPWVYFHHLGYDETAVYYRFDGATFQALPARRKDKPDVFENPTSYQLWSCGPDKTNQTGRDDDVGNVER